jgi:hypothetical protein
VAKRYDRELLVSKVAMMRIKGESTHSILEFLMGKLDESRKISYEILKDAQKYIMEQTNEDTKAAFAESINRLEMLYESGTNKEKLEVMKEMNKLRGLYAAQKVDITSGGEKITEIKIIEVKGETGIKDNNDIQPE